MLLQGYYTVIACRLLCKANSRLGKELTYCQPFAAAKQAGQAADYLAILLLILLLLLEPEIHHSSFVPQLQEPKMPKRFGEDVYKLSTCLDELEDDLSSIDTITKEVILDVDLFAPVMEDRVLVRAMVGWLSTISARTAAGAAKLLGMPLWPLQCTPLACQSATTFCF